MNCSSISAPFGRVVEKRQAVMVSQQTVDLIAVGLIIAEPAKGSGSASSALIKKLIRIGIWIHDRPPSSELA